LCEGGLPPSYLRRRRRGVVSRTNLIERVTPGVRWVRSYERAFIARDVGAGVAVGSMLIPQGLAFAQIVGVTPVAGLWSGIVAMIAYAWFGPSRHLIVGPEAGTAVMVAAVLTRVGMESPTQRLGGSALLAIMVGAVLAVAGMFRLGAISDFLSRPILVGYMNGIALVLIVSQLPGVLGVPSSEGGVVQQLADIGSRLADAHLPTLLLSAGGLVVLLLLRRRLPKVPGPVVIMAAGIALSSALDLQARGIRVLGHIERGLPTIGWGELPVSSLLELAPGALSITLLIYASSALTSRLFADKHRYKFKGNGELFGLAAANLAVGLTHGVPAAGSDARTVINEAAGSRTQAAGLVAAVVVGVVIFLLAPVMALLPTPLLAVVVIASAVSLMDLRGFVRIWRVRVIEGVLAAVTFVGVLILGILPGVLVAVALAIADLVRRAARPHDAVLGRVRGRSGYQDIEHRPGSETLPGLIIYRIDAPLFFANARFLREQVHKLVNDAAVPVRMIVLDCGAMFDLDVTAAETLEDLKRDLDDRGVMLALAEPHAPMRQVLQRSGVLQMVGEQNVFATVDESVRAYVERTKAALGRDIDWQRVGERTGPGGASHDLA
jgi:sulfate permease, SulP family